MGSPDELSHWERICFTPADPRGLLTLRVFVFLMVAVDVFLTRGPIERIPDTAQAVWEPVSLLWVLQVGPPSDALVASLSIVALVASIATAGLQWFNSWKLVTRISGVIASSSYVALALALNSLGKIDHDRQPLVIMAIVMAIAALPDARTEPSSRFAWPVQAVRLSVAVMLISAAWSKMMTSGVSWVFGPNMRNILAAESLVLRNPPLSDLALWIAAEPWRWQLTALGALVGEAILILALVVRKNPWRAGIVLAGAGTLVGITLLMGLVGFPIVALPLVFLSLDRLHQTGLDRQMVTTGLAVTSLVAVLILAHEPLLTLVPPLALAACMAIFLVLSRRSDSQQEAHTMGGL